MFNFWNHILTYTQIEHDTRVGIVDRASVWAQLTLSIIKHMGQGFSTWGEKMAKFERELWGILFALIVLIHIQDVHGMHVM